MGVWLDHRPSLPSRNFKEFHTMASDIQGTKTGRSNRGFASMDPQRQREIASEGGKAAHEKGTAHEFTSEEARAAGRKGGQARSQNRMNRTAGSSSGSTGNSESSGAMR
jgi:general stress protein YciG